MARAMKGVLGVLLLLTAIGYSSTYLRRWATLQGPDVEDYLRLPTRAVANAPGATALPLAINSNWVRDTPFDFQGQRFDQSGQLDAFLSSHGTNAFIVLSEGKVVDARYYNGHQQGSLFKSCSMSTSVLSALFGIAQSEGLISASDRLDEHLQSIKGPGGRRSAPRRSGSLPTRPQEGPTAAGEWLLRAAVPGGGRREVP